MTKIKDVTSSRPADQNPEDLMGNLTKGARVHPPHDVRHVPEPTGHEPARADLLHSARVQRRELMATGRDKEQDQAVHDDHGLDDGMPS
jgi:hypothetical protein